jgi:hypothetical protein
MKTPKPRILFLNQFIPEDFSGLDIQDVELGTGMPEGNATRSQ